MAISDGKGVIVDRSYNSLIFSEGAPPPSMRYIPDPSLPGLFKYSYGGKDTDVVIPKGRIVALNTGAMIKNPETGMRVHPLTIANTDNIPLGVAFTNVYELDYDAPFDMTYGLITNDTIEVPMVATEAEANLVAWGCAWGELRPGDVVRPDAVGHFTRWDGLYDVPVTEDVADFTTGVGETSVTVFTKQPVKVTGAATATAIADGGADPVELPVTILGFGAVALTTVGEVAYTNVKLTYTTTRSDPGDQRVGRVYEIDTNIPPEGWLKWAELPKAGDFTDPPLPLGYTYADRDAYGGYPFDKGYRDGFRVYGPRGIANLTNGANIEVAYTGATVGVIPKGTVSAGKTFHFRLPHYPLVPLSFIPSLGGQAINPDDMAITVDNATGLVTVVVAVGYNAAADATLTAEYSATCQTPGIPSGWDVKGLIGVARIKLIL